MQTSDFNWFVQHLDELYNKFGSCFLSIRDKSILGQYCSYAEAVAETSKKYPIGSFIVQQCGKDERAYTNYISSMNFSNHS